MQARLPEGSPLMGLQHSVAKTHYSSAKQILYTGLLAEVTSEEIHGFKETPFQELLGYKPGF